jgi:hypothetical protein
VNWDIFGGDKSRIVAQRAECFELVSRPVMIGESDPV